MGWKHMAYHIINSDLGHTCSKQQFHKTLKITFASLSRKSDKKEKKKKKILEWQLQRFLHFTQTQKYGRNTYGAETAYTGWSIGI